MQLREDSWQLLARDVEQHRVGEHAVEVTAGQVQFQKVLHQHFASAVLARDRGQLSRPIQADHLMPECLERAEIASWTTPEIQQSEWRWHVDVCQEHLDVLAHIVIARAFPVALGIPVVVRQRAGRDLTQIFRGLWHPDHSIQVRIPGPPLEDGYLNEWASLSAKR